MHNSVHNSVHKVVLFEQMLKTLAQPSGCWFSLNGQNKLSASSHRQPKIIKIASGTVAGQMPSGRYEGQFHDDGPFHENGPNTEPEGWQAIALPKVRHRSFVFGAERKYV